MEDCFAFSLHLRAPIQVQGALSNCVGEVPLVFLFSLFTFHSCRRFAVCAVSRRCHFFVTDCSLDLSRNGANRKRMAIFPCQPLAVALLRYLRQPTNHTWSLDHWFQALTPRRATLGERRMGVVRHPGTTNPRSRIATCNPACIQPKVARLRCFAFGASSRGHAYFVDCRR